MGRWGDGPKLVNWLQSLLQSLLITGHHDTFHWEYCKQKLAVKLATIIQACTR